MSNRSSGEDLTQGNLYKQIIIFSIPLILSNLLQVAFNLADVIVAGRFAGAEALGSVGCTTNLVALFTTFLVGVGSAVNVQVAHGVGMKKEKEVEETMHTAFVVCLIMGLIISILAIAFTGIILRAMNTKDELYRDAVIYMRIYMCGLPALALFNCGNAVYSAVGNTRKPLFFLIISGIANVLFNLLTVIGFGLGAPGVAIASAVSQYLAAALVVISLMREKGIIKLDLKKLKPRRARAIALVRLGLPSGFQYSIFQIANVFIQRGLNSFDAVTVEGAAVANNIDILTYEIMAAFYTACCSFIGQNYGAGNAKRMKKAYLITTMYACLAAFISGALIYLFGRQLLHLFTTEEGVIEAGMMKLSVMAISYWLSAFMDNTSAASRGLGKTLVPNISIIMGSCVFRIIWVCTIFEYFHTVQSLYFVYMFSWTITSIGEIIYFIFIFRKETAKFKKQLA